MRRRPPRSTQSRSSAASDVYKRQDLYKTFYNQESKDKWEAFVKMSHSIEHKIPLLDPCDNLLIPSDRALFNYMFEEVFSCSEFNNELQLHFEETGKTPFKVQIPLTNYVDSTVMSQTEIDSIIQKYDGPTIVKTKIACATSTSHKMALAFNQPALNLSLIHI
eukprot:TRINITY_DN6947_c0_g1_i1.p1 TRINITY_DN6947_c0_g1~~TRINITY_DN6947_c0_g1_i1.p1  ORF type:complete len:163 (+),score=54.34 TRINITY_DN6947_c0_g1_i1:7-495(+)